MKFKIEYGNERLITPSGLAIAGVLINKTRLKPRMDAMKFGDVKNPDLKNSDIVLPYLGLLCQGKNDFDDINEMHEDKDFYADALNIDKIPSSSRMRQRMDGIGKGFEKIIFEENTVLLKNTGAQISPCYKRYVPLDVDVSPFDNSNTKKEGVSRTYLGFDGYAPIFAYLGGEGYLVNMELRTGSTHCQKGTADFLKNALGYAKQITEEPILLRMDSGNDSAENIQLCHKEKYACDFIIKRNLRSESKQVWKIIAENNKHTVCEVPRKGKKVFTGSVEWEVRGVKGKVRIVYEVTERTIDPCGQVLLVPEIDVDTYWTSLDSDEKDIINLYHAHGTSEQFHSEMKTDLDLERLPSGYFDTNALVLQLGSLAYNILRIIGQESIKNDPVAHRKGISRRRVKTVIKNLITIASRVVKHARSIYLKLGRSNIWRYRFKEIYDHFA